MKELKAMFEGQVIMGMGMILVLGLWDTIKYSNIDWSYLCNTMMTVAGFTLLGMLGAYMAWHLETDVKLVRKWMEERRSNKVERA